MLLDSNSKKKIFTIFIQKEIKCKTNTIFKRLTRPLLFVACIKKSIQFFDCIPVFIESI